MPSPRHHPPHSKVAADGDGNRTIHYTPLLKRGSGDGQYAYWEVPVRLLSVTEGGPVSMAQLAAHDRRRGLLDEHAVPQGAVPAGERPASDSAAVHWVERWAASLWPLMPWAAVPAPSLRRMRRPRSAPRRRYPLPPGMERVVQPSRGPPLSSVVPGAGEAWRSGLTLSGAVASGLGADGVARPVHLSGDNTVYSDCGGSDLSCTAIVDTGTSYIGVPGGKWESFMGAVAGGRCAESKGTFMCQTCDLTKFPYINVGTSHQLFVLKPADYVAVDSDSDTCFLQFQRVGGSSMFILGATFIRVRFPLALSHLPAGASPRADGSHARAALLLHLRHGERARAGRGRVVRRSVALPSRTPPRGTPVGDLPGADTARVHTPWPLPLCARAGRTTPRLRGPTQTPSG